jgi:hypothetical protein
VRRGARACPPGIFLPGHIAHVMHPILDGQVTASLRLQVRRAHAAGRQALQGEGHLLAPHAT